MSTGMAYSATTVVALVAMVWLLVLATVPSLEAGRVLLYPYGHGYTSHLVDMRTMGHILRDRSHQVAFLINDVDQKYLASVPDAHYHVFPTPAIRQPLIENEERKASLIAADNVSTTQANILANIIEKHIAMCEQLLRRPGMLAELREREYELLIVDIADNCGRVVSQALGVPTMPYSSTGLIVDQGFFPNLPSFVPAPMSSFTSDMTFWERVANVAIFIILDRIVGPSFYSAFERLQERHGLEGTRRLDFRRAFADQFHLVHADFALDDPRPLLPNVALIGGMFVLPPKPLESGLAAWMDGAGPAGVVLVSFGSLIKQMEAPKAAIIAQSLALLPQRVVWRYDGADPAGLGDNTRLLRWLPQNDLLAHSEMRLFVTHCGIHGTYEAAMHGVPVIAMPLMFDQHANAVKLVKRAQMGVLVDFKSLTNVSFTKALREVLDDPKYSANAKETSRMLRDHPQTPRERFLFWVDYVIRNKGIGKMALEPIKHLGTFELYCMDVVLFMAAVGLVFTVMLVCTVRICCRWVCRRNRPPVKAKTS